jgi:hypothetical protein
MPGRLDHSLREDFVQPAHVLARLQAIDMFSKEMGQDFGQIGMSDFL